MKLYAMLGFAALATLPGIAQAQPGIPKGARSDLIASKEIVGKWVRTASQPSGKLAAICDTDEDDWFLPGGRYEALYEQGAWSINGGTLTISVTRSNYASGGEGPMKRLSKPDVQHLVIENLQNGLAKFRTEKGSGWLVRCSVR